jgi:hypothetical protein
VYIYEKVSSLPHYQGSYKTISSLIPAPAKAQTLMTPKAQNCSFHALRVKTLLIQQGAIEHNLQNTLLE